jgi:hypothetical protein
LLSLYLYICSKSSFFISGKLIIVQMAKLSIPPHPCRY